MLLHSNIHRRHQTLARSSFSTILQLHHPRSGSIMHIHLPSTSQDSMRTPRYLVRIVFLPHTLLQVSTQHSFISSVTQTCHLHRLLPFLLCRSPMAALLLSYRHLRCPTVSRTNTPRMDKACIRTWCRSNTGQQSNQTITRSHTRCRNMRRADTRT